MIDQTLNTTDFPCGYRHEYLESVTSTNKVSFDRALGGDAGNLWISAGCQTAGRARRGREWTSRGGNLFASLLLLDPAPPKEMATLPLCVALSVYDALAPLVARNPQALSIKWPNDILLDDQKISGILLESSFLPNGKNAVVIGCGINCTHHPENPLYPATDLKSCGIDLSASELMVRLAHSLARCLQIWDRGRGFALIRENWLMAAKGIGENITVNFADHQLHGRFYDLDDNGFLLLKDEQGKLHQISAGDLFFK